jgi:hypothetical protein
LPSALLYVVLTLALLEQATPPPVAPPADGASPITINTCGPMVDKNSGTSIAGINVASTSSGMHIQFTNESNRTADLVNFAVNSNGTQFVIRDVGTFSPGVSIDHKYRNGSGQSFVLPAFIPPNIKCSVSSVRFTDGSLWRMGEGSTAASSPASQPNAAQPPKLTANPPRVQIDRLTDSELFMVSSSERVGAFKEVDDCAKVAEVFVAATGQSSASYSVRPLAPGSCTARITDEAGSTLSVPIVVK